MTTDARHVSVLIPARDEEDLLPRCLQSVLEARDALAGMATCDLFVGVDRSMDATFAIARRMLGNTGTVIRSGQASWGWRVPWQRELPCGNGSRELTEYGWRILMRTAGSHRTG